MTKAKNGLGSVRNWFSGAKAKPVPPVSGTTPGVGYNSKNMTTHVYPDHTQVPQRPSWMDTAKSIGGGAMGSLNTVATGLWAADMVGGALGFGGRQEQAPEQQMPQMGMYGQPEYQQPGYYAGYDPRNEPMQGNAGDWFRGIFTAGRNPRVEQEQRMHQFALSNMHEQAAARAGGG